VNGIPATNNGNIEDSGCRSSRCAKASMRFVRPVPWHGPVLPFARQCAARVPHSTLPAAASSGKAQRKPQGIASELLRRSALGWKTAFPPDRASAQPGITKTVRALAFSWIFFRRRPARLFSRNFDRPKNFVLLTSRNGNHAAGFVGDECDEPVERGGASSSVRGGAMVSHAPAKCRRSVAY
jgi:hypothetical protein